MWQWYKQADVCFAFLEDLLGPGAPTLTQSKRFTRGWTLHELVAPKDVIFFDKFWKKIGDRKSLQQELTGRMKIGMDFLLHRQNISRASISQRMSWFAGRDNGSRGYSVLFARSLRWERAALVRRREGARISQTSGGNHEVL